MQPRTLLRVAIKHSPPDLHPADPRHHCGRGTHSTLADGRRLCWRPPSTNGARFAVDAEILDQPVPFALSRRLPAEDQESFWRRWTAAEVGAKLSDVPITQWLRTTDWPRTQPYAVSAGTAYVVTDVVAGVVRSFGVLVTEEGDPLSPRGA